MTPKSDVPLPQLLNEMAVSSVETIFRRTAMIATGRCSMNEYSSMLMEKVGAVQTSYLTLLGGGTAAAVLAPWHSGAVANAKRLRSS